MRRDDWPKAMPIVVVDWTDSHTVGGWLGDVRELEHALHDAGVRCRTVGYLYAADEARGVVIIQDVNAAGNIGQVTCIPSSAVVNLRTVEAVPDA